MNMAIVPLEYGIPGTLYFPLNCFLRNKVSNKAFPHITKQWNTKTNDAWGVFLLEIKSKDVFNNTAINTCQQRGITASVSLYKTGFSFPTISYGEQQLVPIIGRYLLRVNFPPFSFFMVSIYRIIAYS